MGPADPARPARPARPVGRCPGVALVALYAWRTWRAGRTRRTRITLVASRPRHPAHPVHQPHRDRLISRRQPPWVPWVSLGARQPAWSTWSTWVPGIARVALIAFVALVARVPFISLGALLTFDVGSVEVPSPIGVLAKLSAVRVMARDAEDLGSCVTLKPASPDCSVAMTSASAPGSGSSAGSIDADVNSRISVGRVPDAQRGAILLGWPSASRARAAPSGSGRFAAVSMFRRTPLGAKATPGVMRHRPIGGSHPQAPRDFAQAD